LKIAVVGAGISGLSCAWRLAASHDVTLYEAADYFGGHTHSVDVTLKGITHPVDTGFLVFNHQTYPELTRLFESLSVVTVPSEMTFSVRAGAPGRALEWAGTDLNSVFAQRGNLASVRFLRMLFDIVRFNRIATGLAERPAAPANRWSLAKFLKARHFSKAFINWYLLPMAAAIWSCPRQTMLAFPVGTFVRFCHNHGLLQVTNRPQWYTVKNGAREYVRRLLHALEDVRLSEPVQQVRRITAASGAVQIEVVSAKGKDVYDHVVMAAHSDQSLAMLEDASAVEKRILSAIRYQPNHAVLHTDASLLPANKSAWAAWNYECESKDAGHDDEEAHADVCVHYLINKLQPLPFAENVIVSLNPVTEPDEDKVIERFEYSHPVFDQQAIDAQDDLSTLQGQRNTWYCGAWTGYGFHEDGLRSGLEVATGIEGAAASSRSIHIEVVGEA
jgi:predicted NAD/FAD-binding protein